MQNFNQKIERQLDLLNRFWQKPEYANEKWESNEPIQQAYYAFMKENNFLKEGDAPRKAKDARQKTSGMRDIGLIDDNRRLTPVGKKLLEIAKDGDFLSDNFLQIPKDSFIYFQQLLKTYITIDKDSGVRPFILLARLLKKFTYLSKKEWCLTSISEQEIMQVVKYQRISTQKMNKIFLCFSEDITATAAARIAGVNRNTVNSYYGRIRELVFEESLKEAGREFGEFECDESYFGARRVRGKRGRGAAGKTPVFGLLKRGEKVYVKVVESCSRESLMPIIQGLTLEGSTIYTDGWKAYDGLILNGYEHHRVFHHENEFVRGKSHVNGIENFWSFAKGRLAKFNGCDSDRFVLHLKECEWRYNHRHEDLLPLIKKLFRFANS